MASEFGIDCYKILGVKPDASAREIKNAYRKLQKLYHEIYDKQGALDNFKKRCKRINGESEQVYEDRVRRERDDFLRQLNAAKDILEKKRKAYDAYRAAGGAGANADRINFSDGSYYVGENVSGKPHGKGRLYDKNGSLVYHGDWENGSFHGIGRALYPDGQYSGQFVHGKREGTGTYRYDNGNVFQGTLRKNQFVFGSMRYTNGDTYEGEWKNYKPHGLGKIIFKNGGERKGKWKDGVYQKISPYYSLKTSFLDTFETPAKRVTAVSFGIMAWLTGTVAVGALLHNQSLENLDWDDISTYETLSPLETVPGLRELFNDVQDVQYHGAKQPLFVGNAVFYNGYSMGGLPHRSGQIIFEDFSTYRGGFKDGKQHGKGEMLYANGAFYHGDWEDGLRHGYGEMVYEDGSIYEGAWQDGVPTGEGKMLYPDGSFYVGNWYLGEKHGYGVLTKYNGGRLIGVWAHDMSPGDREISSAGTDMKLFNGKRFDGDLEAAIGTISYNNGDKFYGECFKTSYDIRPFNGTKISSSDKMTQTGHWKLGEHFNGSGFYLYEYGAYRGMVLGGSGQGFGEMHGKDSWYKGPWKGGHRDTLSGKTFGLRRSENGTLYFGEWNNNNKEGFGIMLYPESARTDNVVNEKSEHSLYSDAWKHEDNGFDYRPDQTEPSDTFSKSDLYKIWHPYLLDGMGHYEGSWKDDKRSGHGIMRYAHGGSYDGDWLADKRHGKGTYRNASGTVYTGTWEYGDKHGKGSQVFRNGDTYTGIWYKGLRNGHGTYITASGKIYPQEWEKGKLVSGEAIDMPDERREDYSNGYYVGDFRNGKRHGTGTYRWNDGDIYYGHWVNGERTGYGIYEYDDGAVYEGGFETGRLSGYGVMKYANGSLYEGEWKNGDEDGWGRYDGHGSDSYIGQWKKGLRDGYGRALDLDRTRVFGAWIEGKPSFLGQDYKIVTGGYIYDASSGEYLRKIPPKKNYYTPDLWNGQVKIYGDRIYFGQMNNWGNPQGQGIMVYENGRVYEGDWVNGYFQGNGVLFFADGDLYAGEWKNGKPDGDGVGIIGDTTYGGGFFSANWHHGCYKSKAAIYTSLESCQP